MCWNKRISERSDCLNSSLASRIFISMRKNIDTSERFVTVVDFWRIVE